MPKSRSKKKTSWRSLKQWGSSLESTSKINLSRNSKILSTVFENMTRNEFIFYILHYWEPKWLDKDNIYVPPVNKHLIETISTKLYYKSLEIYQNTMLPLLIDEFWYDLKKNWTDKLLDEADKTNEIGKEYRYSNNDLVEKGIIELPPVRQINRKVYSFKLRQITTSYNEYPSQGDLVKIKIIETNSEMFGYIQSMEKNQEVSEGKNQIKTELIYSILTNSSFARSPRKFWFTITSLVWLDLYLPFIDVLKDGITNQILWPTIKTFQVSPVKKIDEYFKSVTKEVLNQEQQKIVATVTKTVENKIPKICLVKGPPGTGKSTVIVNTVESIICRNPSSKILICAPSNKAVDVLVLRLIHKSDILKKNRIPCHIVRVGNEKKIDKGVKRVSLIRQAICKVMETSSKNSLKFSADVDIEEEIYQKVKSYLLNGSSNKDEKTIRDNFFLSIDDFFTTLGICKLLKKSTKDMKKISKELYDATQEILLSANIIACTLSSSCTKAMMRNIYGKKGRYQHEISVCIVDEATNATELQNLLPLLLSVEIMILVGDSNQLRPVVISPRASRAGFNHSLYSRIEAYFSQKNINIVELHLSTQYRMHESIAKWPNKYFYDGSIKNEALLPSLHICNYKLFDHSFEQRYDGRLNRNEAELVIKLINSLVEHFIAKKLSPNICIITPYNCQRKSLNNRLDNFVKENDEKLKAFDIKSIKAYTVDNFQGSESDIIIMSCVRSEGLGFVSDPNRLCVTLTRAKHTLIIFGNFRTFSTNEMWKSLLEDAKKRNVYVNLKDKDTSTKVKLMGEHVKGIQTK